jgi:RNA polymerase sigma-70 factor (ECF subfamily)
VTTVAVSLETLLWSWIARIEDGSERSASARTSSAGRQSASEDEPSLVARAAGDPDAFATLYRRYVQVIHAFVFRRTQNHDLAEDVTAATFERALRNIESFRWRGPGSFAAWLHRIASNMLVDHYRAESRRSPLKAVDTGGDVDSIVVDGTEDIARVRDALTRLRPRYQEVIQLRFFSDLDRDAAAAALGCSLSTLAVLQHRAVRALAKAMESP